MGCHFSRQTLQQTDSRWSSSQDERLTAVKGALKAWAAGAAPTQLAIEQVRNDVRILCLLQLRDAGDFENSTLLIVADRK